MPAANTDKFRKSAARKSTTTSASMSADSDASIACSSLSGWPTDTAVSVVFNRVDGDGTLQNNWETATAVVSANNLTNMVRGVEGTAAAWPSGTVVELIWTADNVNDMVDGITAEHNQDGTHSDVTATTVATTGVITAGSHIDVNDSSTAIRDSSDNELVKFSKTASAVNELTVKNAATGNSPEIQATGGDTNIDLKLTPKGTGLVYGKFAEEVLQFSPGGTTDYSSTSLGDWLTVGTATVPTWATTAIVITTISGVYPITASNAMDIETQVGSVNGRRTRLYSGSHALNDHAASTCIDSLTLSGTGSQSVKIQAIRASGANGVRADSASDVTVYIKYIP